MALPLIKVVQVTVTNRCQCNCKHCGVSKLRAIIRDELSINLLDQLFQDLRLAGCIVVDLFGGEPTLRHDLFDIITRGKSYGFFMSLETNGYVIDKAYMDRLVESGLDQIYLSLDDYRPESHDEIRGRRGSFERAVHALELGAKTGIIMHVSTVPQTRDFFLSGDVNRFMQFVLNHGAEMVRLLLPRYVGDSIREDGSPMCAGEEKELFSHVSAEYRNYIYLHTPGTPLGEKNICTAKQVFCHVMSNGWVAPCPYFPLVFGNAILEPIVDVFERIQSHPLVRLGGEYCPMRNADYINTHIRGLGLDRAFYPIAMKNQIDLGAPCREGCPDCSYGSRFAQRPFEEIAQEIGAVDPEYTRIEFFGGDAFLRDDLFAILNRIPHGKTIILWSTCGELPEQASFMKRLQAYAIEAIKVCIPMPLVARPVDSDGEIEIQEALQRVKALCSWDLPVYIYMPADLAAQLQAHLASTIHQLGAKRLYAFTKDFDRPVANAVGCYGRGLGSAKLYWIDKGDVGASGTAHMS